MRFLHKSGSATSEALKQRLGAFVLWNIFNPSLARTSAGVAIAFRAGRCEGDKPFRAYFTGPGAPMGEVEDLTQVFGGYDIAPVCDPKLFMRGEEIWVTFNTGHFESPNRLYIARVHPEISPPQEVIFAGRQAIEKNWAFFTYGDRLCAVYAMAPLAILVETSGAPEGRIEFEPLHGDPGAAPGHMRGAPTLGPQLAPLGAGQFATIVHRKVHIGKKRLYFGQVALLNARSDGFEAQILPELLAHSPHSLLGNRERHNRNLISCTYFSGLLVEEGRALMSYGINDLAAGFAEVEMRQLVLDVTPGSS